VASWSGLPFRNFLKSPDKLDGRFESQRKCAVGLCLDPISQMVVVKSGLPYHTARQHGLEIPSSISEDDEDDILLLPQTMDPTENPDSLSPVFCKVKKFRLEIVREKFR
jgi:hypothetical protein